MKRWKSWIILLMMIVICMSTFVACRPENEDEIGWGGSGGTQNVGGTENENAENESTDPDGNTEVEQGPAGGTESRFDRFRNRCKWTYEQIVEYYEYGKKNGRMGDVLIGEFIMGVWA